MKQPQGCVRKNKPIHFPMRKKNNKRNKLLQRLLCWFSLWSDFRRRGAVVIIPLPSKNNLSPPRCNKRSVYPRSMQREPTWWRKKYNGRIDDTPTI